MAAFVQSIRVRASWVFVLAIFALVVISNSAWETTAPFVAASEFAAGTFLVAIAAVGRLWCSLYIAGYKNNTLVTSGPYSMCRNPLYFFSLLGALGLGLASETITVPAIILAGFVVYYPIVIRGEERRMQELHGEAFTRYARSVPRFLPRPAITEPQTYLVHPIIFRRHVLATLWFVCLLGVARLIESLHHLRYLPVWLSLY